MKNGSNGNGTALIENTVSGHLGIISDEDAPALVQGEADWLMSHLNITRKQALEIAERTLESHNRIAREADATPID